MKILENKVVLLVSVILVLIFFLVGFGSKSAFDTTIKKTSAPLISPAVQINTFSYKGKAGVDALTLLKDKATIGLDKSGMVEGINGRQSDSSKHEYWAFYINGKLANVGPADYLTKDNDDIEWRIEEY